ncbi:hypothetical protein CDCA_CDCA01G0262 [Cyanidium caldarium]|uniref:Uncharacterized protein n=1 Tax=Cyanidium caldarium TaxID=2771 RepID=A0AAV9IPF9_CYACA|nr:hypothetical protein CDCA_CDCA01G0262 [Cyanidium caldarium]
MGPPSGTRGGRERSVCGGRGWHEGMLDGARRGEEGGGAAAPVAAAAAAAAAACTSNKAQCSAPTSDAFVSVEMVDGPRGALSSSTTEAPSATSEVSGRSSTAGRGDRSFTAVPDAATKRAKGLRAASGAACVMPSRKRRASESLASPTLGLRRSARLLAQVQCQPREEYADEVTAVHAVHASERRQHSARWNVVARRAAKAATGGKRSQERCAGGRKASVAARRRQEISPEGVSPDEATATTTAVSASAPTATAVQTAHIGADAGGEPEPHTPPSDTDPSQRVPPGAPLRRQRVPQPETHERIYAMLGVADASSRSPQHAPRELSREQQTALLNDCADRLLLRRGKCTACGEVKPLRPSSDFCFNLECKIMCERPA